MRKFENILPTWKICYRLLLLLFLFNLCIYLASGVLVVAHEIFDLHCGMQNLFFFYLWHMNS